MVERHVSTDHSFVNVCLYSLAIEIVETDKWSGSEFSLMGYIHPVGVNNYTPLIGLRPTFESQLYQDKSVNEKTINHDKS